MNTTDGLTFVKCTIKLLKEYSIKRNILSPDEFVSSKLKKEDSDRKFEELTEQFLILMKHEKFFKIMVPKFWRYFNLKPFNKEIIITLMFVIIFILNEENKFKTEQIFTHFKYRFCDCVLEYFTVEDNIIEITQAACKVFENDYVLEHILHPLLDKSNLIETMVCQVKNYIKEQKRVEKKSPTKTNPPACAFKISKIPVTPLNTPTKLSVFKRTEISKTVFQGDLKVQEGLVKAHGENKEKAAKLLQYAREKAFKCATTPPKPTVSPVEPPYISPFKCKKVPIKKDVAIKSNAASLMREAATLVKDTESEIKKIEALTQAVFDPTALEGLEEHMRKSKEQEYLRDIERKHLQGQLTYEEAILAKQNLLKANKEKMEKFKKERKEILEEIDLWKQTEQEKIRLLVEKCQGIERRAREAEQKMQQNKRYQAQLIENETKGLLNEAYQRKQEELACKVRLIQELRALEQVRSLHVKEFDPTESPNFGLLCEMSIAELQERLGLLKMELEEELNKRRKNIAESRQKQQELIESVKQFICQNRVTKPKPVPRSPLKLEQTPDLTALRERLQQAKINRISTQRSSVH